MSVPLALDGVKVVEVAQVAAVPMAGRHLADFGADVVHVEPPATGDSWRGFQPGSNLLNAQSTPASYVNYNWENFNRNKRSIALDVSKQAGKDVLFRLLSSADVFLTNLRLFERQKFGLEYSTIHSLYPRMIYGSLTGYGKQGPERNNPAYDSISYWARSGMGHMLSIPGSPPFIDGGALGDNVAGLGLAFGVMLALYVREHTGIGQEVDTSLLHTGIYQLSYYFSGAFATGRDFSEWGSPRREENPNPLILPYETSGHRWLLLAMPQSERYWPRFCDVIERKDLVNDPKYVTQEARAENHLALFRIIEAVFASRPIAEWKSRMTGMIPFSHYQDFIEVTKDVQARSNRVFVPFDHPTYGRIEVIDSPLRLSETPSTPRMAAPEIGQHTEEILLEHGYTWEEIQALKQDGAIP